MVHAVGSAYRTVIVRGRWLVLLAWLALAFVLQSTVQPSSAASSFGSLRPSESPLIQNELRAQQEFPVPVLSGTTVVLYDPSGLPALSRVDSYLKALGDTQQQLQSGAAAAPGTIIAAIPLPTQRRDIAVTYLFSASQTSPRSATDAAEAYAEHFHNVPGQQTFVTGFIPAQVAQSNYLIKYLHVFEILSLVLIVVVVGLAFRSLVAPLLVLAMAGLAYAVHQPVLSLISASYGVAVPDQLQPVLLALLLGVVTDYCVLMLEDFRDHLDQGLDNRAATRAALARQAPIIAVAGLTVAGGTLALLASPLALFRALGPALAFTVVMGVLVSLTVTPAVMSALGWTLFAPLPLRRFRSPRRAAPRQDGASGMARVVATLTRRGPAAAAAAAMTALLIVASLPLGAARLDLSFTSALPASDEVARGAALLQAAGVAGISSPTQVLIEQQDVASHRAELADLQQRIAALPGVAQVLGPADMVTDDRYGLVIARNGNAARFIVILDADPSGADAIARVRTLQQQLPDLIQASGLTPSYSAVTGQTAIASAVAQQTVEALRITLLTALAIELLILIIYLRSLVAPLVLLCVSALVVTSALGLTVLLFQGLLRMGGLTFYAPFASAVLLLALGSDYTVFTVGEIWAETRQRPMPDAIRTAVPRVARAITIAGAILAATFAVVAVIPLATFWEIAFTMTAGLLIDTFLVRPYLTPSLLTLLGRAATWPGHRWHRRSPAPAEPESAPTDCDAR